MAFRGTMENGPSLELSVTGMTHRTGRVLVS